MDGPLEKRAQELIKEAATEIIKYEDQIASLREDIKAVRTTAKDEGLNTTALNTAIKRYRAYLAGKKEVETTLVEADIYLEILKENLV